MNYLYDNLHVACWFKLQRCMLSNAGECHLCILPPYCAEVMIRSLKHLHKIDEFNARTDLLLTPKAMSIIFRVKEIHHTMLPRPTKSNQSKRQWLFENILEKAIRFLLMTIKNPESHLAKVPKPCTILPFPCV